MRAFFKGVWSPALGNIPINALIFASNGICKKYIDSLRLEGGTAERISEN